MADKIVVLRAGRIEQVGAPLALYNKPANRFVAGFIGSPQMNFVPMTVGADRRLWNGASDAIEVPGLSPAAAVGAEVVLGVRPEHLQLAATPGALPLPVIVAQVEQLGGQSMVYGTLPGDAGRITVQCAGQVNARVGDTLTAYAPPAACHVFEQGESGGALT